MEEIKKPDRKEREEGGGPAQRARSAHSKFKKWFLVSASATALIAALSCGDQHGETYIPIPPGNGQVEGDGGSSPDAGLDASTDSDVDTDSGTDLDADTDADTDSGTDLDGGPDLDADTDADTDSGTDLDGGPDLDADTDADTDSGTDLDGGPDLDADTDADTDSGTDLDGGPDLDADTDADTDSGTDLDGGPDLDADTDADTDSGTYIPCAGVYNDADYGVPIYSSTGHDTGGYLFYYSGYDSVSGDITVDIMCGSETVQLDVLVLAGTTQVIDLTSDGKRVSITNLSSGPTTANVNIIVEDIPSGGPDGGVDGGVSDGGPDADGGVFTPVCTGVTNGALYGYPLYTGNSISVGGYVVTNNGGSSGGIEVDVDCGSDSSTVVSSLYLPAGSTEVVYDIPADGKRIRLHNHSSSSLVSNLSVVVEDL